VCNLEKHRLSAAWIALHLDNGLDGIFDIQGAGEAVVRGTITFVAGLPAQFILLAVKVHRSINSVKEVVLGDVRWEVDLIDDIFSDGNLNHNLSSC